MKKKIFILLFLLLIVLLSACSTPQIEHQTCTYPYPPIAGKEVAKELRVICRNEKDCEHLIEFFQRYEKHFDVLTYRINEQTK